MADLYINKLDMNEKAPQIDCVERQQQHVGPIRRKGLRLYSLYLGKVIILGMGIWSVLFVAFYCLSSYVYHRSSFVVYA